MSTCAGFGRTLVSPTVETRRNHHHGWSPPGLGTQISGGAITTRSISADKIAVNELSAITANLGNINAGAININNRFMVGADGTTTIQSAPYGQHTVISNGQTLVYDTNNILRVRLGVW